MSDARITAGYLEQQRELHARPGGFGGKGHKWAPTVLGLAAEVNAQSLLDYGCGQGSLMRELHRTLPVGSRVFDYDPAIPGRDAPPAPADVVVCTDVLEHVEPECLTAVLAHLRALTLKALFVVIALGPANKVLADGRNAHLILQKREDWALQLARAGFRIRSASHLPYPKKYDPAMQIHKRWIAIGDPC